MDNLYLPIMKALADLTAFNKRKLDVMKHLLFYKAEKHEHFRKELVLSGSKELVENTVNNFWGEMKTNLERA